MPPKPNTSWAIASLISSSSGCLLFIALFPLAEEYGNIANRSAGVGIIWMVLHILLALAFCFLGTACGIIALARTNSGRFVGRIKAWTGILLGVLPFVIYLAFMILAPDHRPDFLR
jgi:hypothetical protein